MKKNEIKFGYLHAVLAGLISFTMGFIFAKE